jgi:hypothetical protein
LVSDATTGDVSSGEGGEADVDALPIAPGDLDDGGPVVEVEGDPPSDLTAHLADDIESVAERRQRRGTNRRALCRPLSQVQTAILGLALVSTRRSDVVGVLPQTTAFFYALLGLPLNLRGLTFEDVVFSSEQHEGAPILVIAAMSLTTPIRPRKCRGSNSSCTTRAEGNLFLEGGSRARLIVAGRGARLSHAARLTAGRRARSRPLFRHPARRCRGTTLDIPWRAF